MVDSPEKPPALKPKRSRYFEWINGPYNPVRGEEALWVAVITQAMMDALGRATHSEAAYCKHEATRWLTETSKDFITVCTLAGFDPGYVRKCAKRALASPRAWRAEAGKGARYEERKTYRQRLKQLQEKNPNSPSTLKENQS